MIIRSSLIRYLTGCQKKRKKHDEREHRIKVGAGQTLCMINGASKRSALLSSKQTYTDERATQKYSLQLLMNVASNQ